MLERLKQNLPDFKTSAPLLILFTVTLLLIILFVLWFVTQEKYIYFWDYSNYFSLYTELGQKFLEKPLKALDSINVSIRKADYNNAGVVPLLPFYYIFGAGRLAFISSIAVVYAFSIIIFFPVLLRKITDFDFGTSKIEKLLFFIVGIITLGLLPQFWIPILLGYIDVAGVGVIFLILYFYFRKNLSEQSWKESVRIGLLLCLLIILQRWYAYWVVGFFAAMLAQVIFDYFKDKAGIENLKVSLKNILIIGATSVLTFFALATQIAVKMLTTDYKDIYSAYKHNASIFQDFEKLYAHFGLFTVSLGVLGIITMFAKKNLRRYAGFFTILFAVTFYLFTRTQDIDLHHYYWVLSILVIFAAVFIVEIFAKLGKISLKIGFVSAFLIISLANFSVVFSPKAENYLSPLSFAFPKARLAPKVRNDLEQIHQLLIKLNDLTQNSDKKIYVLSSSIFLNSSILANGSYQFETNLQRLKNNILTSSDVDKRDGFPFQIYKADYVVASDPPGLHLSPEDQKVVGVLAEQFLNRQTIGNAFVKLPDEFTLDDGKKVFIYQKERKFTSDELLKISQMFTEFYPNNKEKFEIKPEIVKELTNAETRTK